MTLDAALRRFNRASVGWRSSSRRGSGVAGEAFDLVVRGACRAGALVGVVASDAAERAAALGIATAQRPADSLGADPGRLGRVVAAEAPVQDVAVVTLFGRDGLRRSVRGVYDRRVREAGLECGDVVTARTVAPFAANGAVGRLGADRLMTGSRVGHMAVKAFGYAVPYTDRFALELSTASA